MEASNLSDVEVKVMATRALSLSFCYPYDAGVVVFPVVPKVL